MKIWAMYPEMEHVWAVRAQIRLCICVFPTARNIFQILWKQKMEKRLFLSMCMVMYPNPSLHCSHVMMIFFLMSRLIWCLYKMTYNSFRKNRSNKSIPIFFWLVFANLNVICSALNTPYIHTEHITVLQEGTEII